MSKVINIPIYIGGIIHDTIVDGPGIRTSIYLSGCNHACIGCHNQQTWNPKYGQLVTVLEIIKELEKDPSDYGVTISGGEPFYNVENLLILLNAIKLNFPSKNILVYTGYYLQDLTSTKQKEALKLIDILIDGPFELKNRDYSLKFRGSSNQTIHYLSKK